MTIIRIENAISVDFISDDNDNDDDDYELRLPLYYPHIISNGRLSHYENTLRITFLIL
jgi:hypothetical protein